LEKIYLIKQRPQNKKVSIILPAQNLNDFLDKVKNISAQKFDTSAYKKLIQQIRKNSQ
jgi:tRNA A37 threonylcarbamoyladenosine synthetase subunit TsaC/SUA5/YrdC